MAVTCGVVGVSLSRSYYWVGGREPFARESPHTRLLQLVRWSRVRFRGILGAPTIDIGLTVECEE